MAPGRTRRSCTLGLTGRRELWVSSPKGAWCHWCIAQHTKGALQSTNGAAEGPLHRHESGKTSSARQAQRKSFELKHFLLLLFQLLFACDEVFCSKKREKRILTAAARTASTSRRQTSARVQKFREDGLRDRRLHWAAVCSGKETRGATKMSFTEWASSTTSSLSRTQELGIGVEDHVHEGVG